MRQKLPTRLLRLVEDYPFGEVPALSECPPQPPPSSFGRRTLRVIIESDLPSSSASSNPSAILRAALTARARTTPEIPIRSSIRNKPKHGEQAETTSLEGLLSTESIAFLGEVSSLGAKRDHTPEPPEPVDEGPLYRPFSTIRASRATSGGPSSQRSQSYGDLRVPAQPARDVSVSESSPVSLGESSSSALTRDRYSMARLDDWAADRTRPTETTGSSWDDFRASGFGVSENPENFSLSPRIPSEVLSPSRPNSVMGQNGDFSHRRYQARQAEKTPPATYTIVREDVIDVDDVFMAFVEDAQLDSAVVAAWPLFSLVRLKSPILTPDPTSHIGGKDIEWLLVTLEHRPSIPLKPADERLDATRSPTPGPASTSTKTRLRDITTSFRRSSSFGGKKGFRRSPSGPSVGPLSTQTGQAMTLTPLSETAPLVTPVSASSVTSSQHTVGEMGEVLQSPKAIQSPSTRVAETINDTAPSDWVYKAEGGAHLIFGYRGVVPVYVGRVLRITKTAGTDTDAQSEWRDRLLPLLVPSNLLVRSEEVTLGSDWLRRLLVNTESHRPESRKPLTELEDTPSGRHIKACVMEDLTTNTGPGQETVLAVEIKVSSRFSQVDSS